MKSSFAKQKQLLDLRHRNFKVTYKAKEKGCIFAKRQPFFIYAKHIIGFAKHITGFAKHVIIGFAKRGTDFAKRGTGLPTMSLSGSR